MDDDQSPQPENIPAVPPVVPGVVPEVVLPSKWPKVLGVVAIIFGVLGALGAVGGAAAVTMTSELAKSDSPELLKQMEQMRGWTLATSSLTFIVALLLLAAGMGLVNRRRWGVTTARLWAVLKMLVVVVNMGVTLHLQEASFQSNPALVGRGVAVAVVQSLTLVLGLVFGWALPVFMLIWLARGKVKAETATWK